VIRLRNDLYCVGWGVKLYSLTHYKPWSDGWPSMVQCAIFDTSKVDRLLLCLTLICYVERSFIVAV